MKTFKFLAIALLILLVASFGFSEETRRSATVVRIDGNVMIKSPGLHPWAGAKVGDVLNEGFFIKTAAGAKAVVAVDDGKTAFVEINEKSLLSFAMLTKERATEMKKTLLDLSVGQVIIKARQLETPDSKFEVKTPTSVVGVRGTKFSVKVDALR